MSYKAIVIGAGLSGAVMAERMASQLGWKVLVLEQRDHIGGNCFDEYDEHGVLIHRYGPHLFHTDSKVVWDYLSQFTEWLPYEHRVLSRIDEQGHLHAPIFADLLVRDPLTLQPVGVGEPGLLQVLSSIPKSYPGHSLLTEDLGVLLGEDDCPCGRHGRYFQVSGRQAGAEVRGCSDTFQ